MPAGGQGRRRLLAKAMPVKPQKGQRQAQATMPDGAKPGTVAGLRKRLKTRAAAGS